MISVCIATFNGEDFLCDQLNSIFSQLDLNDEVIVVDDCSTDKTYEMLLCINDSRLKVYRNKINEGHLKAFETSIRLASGDYIFLSDQDDIWVEGRAKFMLKELSHKKFVASNYELIDRFNNPLECLISYPLKEKNSDKWIYNVYSIFMGRSNYFGCAIAFNSSLKSIILPFPVFIESHDLWIATVANLFKSVCHIEGSTLLRRIHGNNHSVVQRSFAAKLYSRFIFLRLIILFIYRCINVKY